MYRFIKIYDDVQYFESNNLMGEIYNYPFGKNPQIIQIYIYNYIQHKNLIQSKSTRLNNYVMFS